MATSVLIFLYFPACPPPHHPPLPFPTPSTLRIMSCLPFERGRILDGFPWMWALFTQLVRALCAAWCNNMSCTWLFQEMEPYLPLTSQAVRFCLSGTTVLFWVSIFLNHRFNIFQRCWSLPIIILTQIGFNHDVNICFHYCSADFILSFKVHFNSDFFFFFFKALEICH